MSSDRTMLYGLVGNPVAHSLSPFIMNRAFQMIGMDAVYMSFGIRPGTLETSVGGLWEMGAAGINVTYPFKEEALYQLDIVASDAELVQAVNTLVFMDDGIHGYNTDAPGTVAALEVFADLPVDGASVFVYGGGGSARAAAYGLLESGAKRVTFGVRSPERMHMALERFGYAFPEQEVTCVGLSDITQRAVYLAAFAEADVVINATPVGMSGGVDGCLIDEPSWINPRQCFFDFVYHPRRTRFLDVAARAGARTLGGIALLVAQAQEAFRIWTDQGFDMKEMAEAVEVFAQSSTMPTKGVN